MKFITIILLTFSVTLFAQNSNSLLWKVSGKNMPKPSYLFGTIHMIPKNDYFFSPVMQKAFNSCQVLVIEADMFNMSFNQKIDLANKVLLPNNKTLLHYIDTTLYSQFVKILTDSLGISKRTIEKKYNRVKPVFLSALILQEYIGKTKTYEHELYKMSKKNKMTLMALETVDFQIELTNSIDIETQITDLTNMDDYRGYYQMVNLYKNQNIDRLYSLNADSFADTVYRYAFIDNRNKNWIPIIESIMLKNASFIAVGAMHLPGQNGVIELLKKQGYVVEPVK